MEGSEVDIFVKAPDRMLLLLLKPIAEVKKSQLINDYENIIAYSEESKQSEVYVNKCDLFQKHLRVLEISATSGKLDYFYSHSSLETVFPALKLTQIVL